MQTENTGNSESYAHRPSSAQPLAAVLSDFERYLRTERMYAERTVRSYCGTVRTLDSFLAVECAGVDLTSCSTRDLTLYLSGTPEGSRRSAATWNRECAALRSLFGYLGARELITRDPTIGLLRQRTRTREVTPLSFDEMLRLLDAASRSTPLYRERNVALVTTMFHCALRVAELASLRLDQVDMDSRTFRGVRVKGGKIIEVAFNDVTSASLEAYLECRSAFLDEDQVSGALFLSDRGRVISTRTVEVLVRDLAQSAKIERRVTPHLLRHSCASALAGLGTPISVIQQVCGHSSVTTTQRYVHLPASERRVALDSLSVEWKRHAGERSRHLDA